MACRLFGTKPLFKSKLGYCPLEQNLNQNTNIFIHKNVSKNIIYEIAAILSKGRWVNVRKVGLWQGIGAHSYYTCCTMYRNRMSVFLVYSHLCAIPVLSPVQILGIWHIPDPYSKFHFTIVPVQVTKMITITQVNKYFKHTNRLHPR